ncbi:hypothetical protein P19250A_0053 [Methylophilaceae phage P19250A]|nr:hypothetical protein P19250A_0053 [Methylophilaceae phage P19250A]
MKKVYSIHEAEIVSPSVTIGEFFLKLLHAATNGHILHLQTKSYSEHKALQGYYEKLPDAVDAIIEQYQGAYQIIIEYPATYEAPKPDALQEVTYIRDFIVANRAVIGDYTSLQNEVDALLSIVESTMYKLTFLD